MSETSPPDKPHMYFNLPSGDILRVAELTPRMDNQEQLRPFSDGVAAVMHDSWTAKFVRPGVLLPEERDNAIKDSYQQREAINETWIRDEMARQFGRASRAARYFITSATGYAPPASPDDIRAVLRVEPYKPQLPRFGNLGRKPYPQVTDLETRSGRLLDGEYQLDALALMRTALRIAHPARKIAAYTERENPDGLDFFRSLGFKDRNRDQAVAVGRRPGKDDEPAYSIYVHYTHLEVPRALGIQDRLRNLVDRQLAD